MPNFRQSALSPEKRRKLEHKYGPGAAERRARRVALGISDVRTASKRKIARARRLGVLPGGDLPRSGDGRVRNPFGAPRKSGHSLAASSASPALQMKGGPAGGKPVSLPMAFPGIGPAQGNSLAARAARASASARRRRPSRRSFDAVTAGNGQRHYS